MSLRLDSSDSGETLRRFKRLSVCQSSLQKRRETSTSPHRKQTSHSVRLPTFTQTFRRTHLMTGQEEDEMRTTRPRCRVSDQLKYLIIRQQISYQFFLFSVFVLNNQRD